MRVLCVRHGEAIAPNLAQDAVRWLTETGRGVVRHAGARLRADGVIPTRVVTSPLVRAVQTAEILIGEVAFPGVVQADSALSEGSTRRMVDLIDLGTDDDILMLVGHEPSIRALAAHLVSDAQVEPFLPGTILAANWSSTAGRGHFEWRLDPTGA